MRSGWHRAQAQGWRGLTDARAAGGAGNSLGPPSFTGLLTALSLPLLLPWVTDSFTQKLLWLIHASACSFTYPFTGQERVSSLSLLI